MPLWHSVIAWPICLLVFYDLVCPQHMHRVPCFLLAHSTASDGGEDGGAVARTAWRRRRPRIRRWLRLSRRAHSGRGLISLGGECAARPESELPSRRDRSLPTPSLTGSVIASERRRQLLAAVLAVVRVPPLVPSARLLPRRHSRRNMRPTPRAAPVLQHLARPARSGCLGCCRRCCRSVRVAVCARAARGRGD